jgi:formylglycine-generating enzyme required for sulfatase activity
MSETPVTNQQYVDFLNQVLPNIEVEDGQVLHNEKAWLRLGEVIRGYKPIVYREGRFHIKDAMHAACPVIRVTGYGAAAYAEHYGMSLPTDAEWLHVLMKGTKAERTKDNIPATGTGQLQLPIPTPVMFYEPNAYGIRALNQNIGEWGLRSENEGSNLENNEYVVLGRLKSISETNNTNPAIIRRAPRKSFADVGFRTVKKAIEAHGTTASLGAQSRPDTRSHD